jgi:hypothetical protein
MWPCVRTAQAIRVKSSAGDTADAGSVTASDPCLLTTGLGSVTFIEPGKSRAR